MDAAAVVALVAGDEVVKNVMFGSIVGECVDLCGAWHYEGVGAECDDGPGDEPFASVDRDVGEPPRAGINDEMRDLCRPVVRRRRQ